MTNTITTDIAAPLLALYGSFVAGDLDGVRATLADDVVLHVPGHQPLTGDHAGRDGVVEFLLASQAATEGQERVELLDVLTGGSFAAAYCRISGERPGREPLENRTAHVMRVEDGLIREIWFHNFDQDNVDQFWS